MSDAPPPGPAADPLTRKTSALARSDLFSGLDAVTAKRLAVLAEWRTVASGAVVFCKGDPGTHLFIVHSGRVKISTGAADGREVTLNLLGPGTAFGEMAFADGGVRTADAVATEPTELFALSRSRFLPLLSDHPDMMLQMLAAVCERARWLAESYEDSAFLDLTKRLAKRLLLLSRSFGYDTPSGRRLAVSLPHHELAAHMNVTRESVNRLLRKWQREGLIEEHRGIVVLKDLARLQGIASATD